MDFQMERSALAHDWDFHSSPMTNPRQVLHEQSICVGSDFITNTVHSDLQDAVTASGNSGPGQAPVGPAPVRR